VSRLDSLASKSTELISVDAIQPLLNLPRGRARTDRELVEHARREVDFADHHGLDGVKQFDTLAHSAVINHA